MVRRSSAATAHHSRSAKVAVAFCCSLRTFGGTTARRLACGGTGLAAGAGRAPRGALDTGRAGPAGPGAAADGLAAAGAAAAGAAAVGFGGRHVSQPSFSLPATSGASPPQDGHRAGA